MSERAYGAFQRSFVLLEEVNRDKIAADLATGVLTITLRKTAEVQKPAQKIHVQEDRDERRLRFRPRAAPPPPYWNR